MHHLIALLFPKHNIILSDEVQNELQSYALARRIIRNCATEHNTYFSSPFELASKGNYLRLSTTLDFHKYPHFPPNLTIQIHKPTATPSILYRSTLPEQILNLLIVAMADDILNDPVIAFFEAGRNPSLKHTIQTVLNKWHNNRIKRLIPIKYNPDPDELEIIIKGRPAYPEHLIHLRNLEALNFFNRFHRQSILLQVPEITLMRLFAIYHFNYEDLQP